MAVAFFPLNCINSLGVGAILAYLVHYQPQVVKKMTQPLIAYPSIFVLAGIILLIHKFEWWGVKQDREEFIAALLSVFIIARASTNGFKYLP